MAKSRIGPFALEAPLSRAGSSGQVFRGIHLQQKKLAALRIFSIPLGMTPESREAFASQLEQLKQLRHPGIVRCYGGGFDTRSAFLAYELVDGESLAATLNRRERLPWETALDYCQQMAEGLQYAHQMGWIHGRLRPEKILVSREGKIKIGDWRRAAITSMISAGPPQREQLQYAAPESFDGAVADEKSDLYALGAILVTMLTGHPPYDAPDTQTLIHRIQHDPIPNVSATVLDCPVWLNAIAEQLLAKDPRQRTFSATALQLALKEAQRRQSEGVGVLQHATAGFSPLKLKTDRDEAEKVLGIKPKKAKKVSEESFLEQPWVLITALIMALCAAVWFMLPLSEKALRQRAETMLASQEWTEWNDARDGYLVELIDRFPEGSNAEWAAEKIEWVNGREAERRLERDERLGRRDDWTQAQIQYAEARKFERFGDLATAFDKYRAILRLFRGRADDQPILFLASEGIARIRQAGTQNNALQQLLFDKLAEAQAAYDRANLAQSKMILESILELYADNQEVAPLVEQAQQKLSEIGRK